MNKYLIKVSGRNIKNFLLKLDRQNICILNIKEVGENAANILIYSCDFEKITKLKGIYEIEIIKEYGVNALKKMIKKNMHLTIIIILNIFLVCFFSNFIYKVEVIENNKEISNFIMKVLETKGIKKFNKKPKDLEKIKIEILNENKDNLEWIEIIPTGVKYTIKLEARIKNKEILAKKPSNIVAKKEGVIKKIIATSGKIVATKDTFVKKGDILITGILSDDKKVPSIGNVYAEVWYKVTIMVPIHEKEFRETGKTKKGLKIKFFDKELNFYKKYKYNKIDETVIFKNSIVPFYLSFDTIKEVNYLDKIYTIDEGIKVALEKAKALISKKHEKSESIIRENELKVEVNNSKIIVDILVVAYENIGVQEGIEDGNV